MVLISHYVTIKAFKDELLIRLSVLNTIGQCLCVWVSFSGGGENLEKKFHAYGDDTITGF